MKVLMRNNILVLSQNTSPRHLLNIKRMIATLQWSKLAILSSASTSWYHAQRRTQYQCWKLLPKSITWILITKDHYITHTEGQSTKWLAVLFKNVENMRNRENLNYCSRLKETNNMRSKCNTWSWVRSWIWKKNILFVVKDMNEAIGNT